MNKAILQQDYIAYAYICAGAIECGIPNVVPSAFASVNLSLVAVPVLRLCMLIAIFSIESSAGFPDAVVELCILQVLTHPDPLAQSIYLSYSVILLCNVATTCSTL